MPTLEILSGALAGQTFAFTEEVKVGKDDTCRVKVADPGVSRFHARLFRDGGQLSVEDVGSSNGTFVNFKKLSKGEKSSLADRDILFFGRTVAKFWADAPPESGGASAELLRSTVPWKGLACPRCNHGLEAELEARAREQEQVEVIRRLRLHELDAAALDRLLAQAR